MTSRLAVLNMADLVDYSRLMGEDEDAAIGVIRALKGEHLEPHITAHGGEVLKRMGDGWIFAFSSVTSAMQSAMEVQKNLAAHPLIKLRMGIHMGEIVVDEDDFYGSSVNIAQRLQTEAPPGGIMISQDLHRQLTGDLSRSFDDAGTFKLKNIALPIHGYQWRPPTGHPLKSGEVPTITIEPITCPPGDMETEAAAQDIHDELVVRLSRRTGVSILDESGASAGASVYVLRGRLRISGNRGRFSLSLLVRESGISMWTQSYDGDPSDIFTFCDQLVERAMADLRVQINAFDDSRNAHVPDDRLSLSELRGRAAANFYKTTMEGWENAIRLLNRALVLNPDDAMALAMRAHATAILATARYEDLAPEEIARLTLDLDRAVEASPRSDYMFAARTHLRVFLQRDTAGAIQDAKRALSINPSYHIAFDGRGMAHLMEGNLEAAIQDLEKACYFSEADPLRPYRLFALAIALHFADRQEKALETIDSAIQLRPSQRSYHVLKALICRAAGNEAAAEAAEARAAQLPGEPSVLAPNLPMPEDRAGFMAQFRPE